MNTKKAILIGIIFGLIPVIIFLLTLLFCTDELGCLIFISVPALPGIGLSYLFGIDPAKRILGIAASAYLTIFVWFLVGFLGTLLVQWIRSKIKQ